MSAGARPRILVVDDVPLFREVEALQRDKATDAAFTKMDEALRLAHEALPVKEDGTGAK